MGVYKFSLGNSLQSVGDFETLCVDEGFIFVKSKKKLYEFWEKASFISDFEIQASSVGTNEELILCPF